MLSKRMPRLRLCLAGSGFSQFESLGGYPLALEKSDRIFLSGNLTTSDGAISLPAARACAETIVRLSNLELTALPICVSVPWLMFRLTRHSFLLPMRNPDDRPLP